MLNKLDVFFRRLALIVVGHRRRWRYGLCFFHPLAPGLAALPITTTSSGRATWSISRSGAILNSRCRFQCVRTANWRPHWSKICRPWARAPRPRARDIEQALGKFIRDPVVTVIVTGFVGPYSEQIRVIGEAAKAPNSRL